jgi:hypothetical protein
MKNKLAIFLMFMISFLNAQIEDHEIGLMNEIALEEQEIIEALALYPREVWETKRFPGTSHSIENFNFQIPIPQDTDTKTRVPEAAVRYFLQKHLRKDRAAIKFNKAQNYHKQTWQRSITKFSTINKTTVTPKKSSPNRKTNPRSPPGNN